MMAPHPTFRFAAPKETEKGTVLLIEDDVPVAQGLIRVMNAEGYEVVHVGTGSAAVDKVMHRSFDAVISDLHLPGASGVEVLNVVRAHDPDVPLVLMTGSPTVDTAIEACSLGVLEYLVKPTPRDQLVRVLGRATEARRTALHCREAVNAERYASTVDTVRPPPISGEAATARGRTLPAPSFDAHSAVTDGVDALELVELNASASRNAKALAFAETVAAMPAATSSRTRPSLRATLERAMESLVVELEPVIDRETKTLVGYAARVSSAEETLSTEAALVVTAERSGRLCQLRHRVRDLAVNAFVSCPPHALLFIDVLPSDLKGGDLYSPDPPLARIADRVVLQVPARGLTMSDLSARASVLRFLGFRLAIADLDAGQACLEQIAELSPEYVKIAARLVRGLDVSTGRKRLVGALVAMCRSLDAIVIAEGVSTAEECDALQAAGCGMVQGSIAARHAPPSSRKPAVVRATASSTSAGRAETRPRSSPSRSA